MSELNDYMWEQIELNSYGKDKLVHIVNEQAKEVSIMREALERIAYMDNGVLSKGLYCSKIAKEALQRVGGEG